MTGNKFKLGLFFTAGLIITVVLIFWLSGGFREQNTVTYVSYFPWSVQGLNEGSNVLYNGVTVGHVSSIDIAPDGRLVEVLMKIRSDFHMDSTIVATMQLIGITGLRIINLSADSVNRVRRRHYSFQTDHEIIPVGEGAIQTVTSTLTRLTEIIYEVDFKRISENLVKLLENANDILGSDRIDLLEESLLSNSRHLDTMLVVYTKLGRDMDRLVLEFQVMTPELGSNLDSLVTELHDLSGPVSDLAIKLDAFMDESSEMMNSLSALLEILRSDPWQLLIRTSGEGVWQ